MFYARGNLALSTVSQFRRPNRSGIVGRIRRAESNSSSSSSAATAKERANVTPSSSRDGWISWYSRKLDTHPLFTMAISSGLIAGGGDFMCQTLIEQPTSYDAMRTARFTLLGTVVVAPFVHAWYSFLNARIPGFGIAAVTKRVALDQFVFSPCFLSIWLPCLWTLEGERDGAVMGQRIISSMPSVMVANWGLWIPAQIINFRFVPTKFQVLYSNFIALIWNVYLSYSQTRKESK